MRKVFGAVSIAHELADVEIREKFSLNEDEIQNLYTRLKDFFAIQEALILSTCNRTEIYYFHSEDNNNQIISLLCSFKGADSDVYKKYFKLFIDKCAINYLHQVAVGVQSQVLGDIQIFGQIKQAYQLSSDSGMSSTNMHRLMHRVFYCHKNIAQNTTFKQGASSISYHVNLLLKHNHLSSQILIVGAGQMGRDIVSHMSKQGFTNVAITNRTLEKSDQLAKEYGYKSVPFLFKKQAIDSADVVISTITTPHIVFHAEDFNYKKTKVVVDVSSPRSVSESIVDQGISLYNIDYLGKMVNEVLSSRKAELPEVNKWIDTSVEEYMGWQSENEFTGHVTKFKETLEELQRQTVASMIKKMDQEQLKIAENITKTMIQKIVNLPVLQIKNACKRGEAEKLSDSLNELFDMEYVNNVKS